MQTIRTWSRSTALLLALGTIAGCSGSDSGDNGGSKCGVTLSGATTASLACTQATAVFSASDNVSAVGIVPPGNTPLVILSIEVPGELSAKTYHSTDASVITALAVTNGSDGWQTAGGDGPAIGSATLTITSVSTMTSDADGKVYVAHGTITATLVADPSTTATGTVTLTANF